MQPLTRSRPRPRFFGTSGPSFALDFVNGTNALDPRVTFTRASTATYFDASGVLQSAANNVPRFDYNPSTLAAQGLLIEESRTNSIRNNTMQGAVAGTPGTLPTNWQKSENSSMAINIVGVGTENGVQYVDVQYVGTASGTNSTSIQFEQNSAIAAANGQTWTVSSFVKIQSGTTTGVSQIRFGWEERSGSFLAVQQGGINPVASGSLASARLAFTATNGNASTTFIKPFINFTPVNGAAIDITLRIGLPQLELGAFPTSVIPTTTTALTRAADVASVNTLSPWYNASAGTLYVEAQSPAVAGTYFYYSLNNGTTNEIRLGSAGSGSNPTFVVTNSSSSQAAIAGTLAAGTPFKAASAYATNSFNLSVNTSIGADDTSGTPPVATSLRLGARSNDTLYINGYLRRITYYPRRLSNAELQAITA